MPKFGLQAFCKATVTSERVVHACSQPHLLNFVQFAGSEIGKNLQRAMGAFSISTFHEADVLSAVRGNNLSKIEVLPKSEKGLYPAGRCLRKFTGISQKEVCLCSACDRT